MVEEEKRIDDDLDFEVAKSTKYITQFMRRPVTEKGRTAARPSICFSRPFSSPPVRSRHILFLSA